MPTTAGNAIYSKNAEGHEQFFSYANTSTSEFFIQDSPTCHFQYLDFSCMFLLFLSLCINSIKVRVWMEKRDPRTLNRYSYAGNNPMK